MSKCCTLGQLQQCRRYALKINFEEVEGRRSSRGTGDSFILLNFDLLLWRGFLGGFGSSLALRVESGLGSRLRRGVGAGARV